MTYVCPIWVQTTHIELRVVSAESGDWHWSVRIAEGQTLREGTMPSKYAAQVASQRAFKERLQRAGLIRLAPDGYIWKELFAIRV